MILKPHPNFRLFLTVNPTYGEVSRAMRNRGVEIFMMQPYWLLDEASGYNCAEFELKDFKRFLVLSGVPGGKLVDSMAKAHVYAKNGGLHLNVQITYLELARWVQLFQQLLKNGNHALWSLQISWEHTYQSSLGGSGGWDIINHAKIAFLSTAIFLESDLPMELSLYMPGGWPMPLKLRDFIWHSKETSVKQNCMYLEYLVVQYELGVSCNRGHMDRVLFATSHMGAYLMDGKTLQQLMFPKCSNQKISSSCSNPDFDLKLAKKMLLFAANWIIEQATENDYKLYFLRLSWLSSKLDCFDNFLNSFQQLLQQEFDHPVWKCIFHCHHELASLNQVDLNLQPMPLLSLDLVDLTASNDMSKAWLKHLSNAINCVGLLRLSYQQWNAQSRHDYITEAPHFKPILESLRELEKEVLDMLVESPSYDLLINLYRDLLEDHMVFWDAVTSSRTELLVISWHYVMKDVLKLRDFCPQAVNNVLVVS